MVIFPDFFLLELSKSFPRGKLIRRSLSLSNRMMAFLYMKIPQSRESNHKLNTILNNFIFIPIAFFTEIVIKDYFHNTSMTKR